MKLNNLYHGNKITNRNKRNITTQFLINKLGDDFLSNCNEN